MLEALVDGDAALDVDGQHAVDQVKGNVRNGVPVRRRVVEAAHLDLLCECVRVRGRVEFVAEGREAAQANVEHHAQGPNVDGASVTAVVCLFKDFGGDV